MAAPTSVVPDSAEKLQKMISSQKSLLARAKAGSLRLPDGGAKIASKLEELEASLLRLQFRTSPRNTTSHSSPQILTSSLTNLPPAEHDSLPSARTKILHASNPNTATAASTGRIVEREIPMHHGYLAPSVSGQNERPPDIAMAEATMAFSEVSLRQGGGNPNAGTAATAGRVVEPQILQDDLSPSVSILDGRPPDFVMSEATSSVAGSDAAVEILHGEGGGGKPSEPEIRQDNLFPSVSGQNERPPDIVMAEATSTVAVSDAAVEILHGEGGGGNTSEAEGGRNPSQAPSLSEGLHGEGGGGNTSEAEGGRNPSQAPSLSEGLHGEGGGGNPSEAQSLSEGLHGGGGRRKLDGVETMVGASGRGRGFLQQAGVFPLPANADGGEGGQGTGGSVPLDRVGGTGDVGNRAVVRARVAERGQAATERAMARFLRVKDKVQIRAGSIEPVGGRLRPGAVKEVREQVMQERGAQIDREAERLSATLRIVEEESMEVEGASSNGSAIRRTNLAGTVHDSFHSSGLRSVNLISITEAADLLRAHNDEVKKIEEGILARSSVGRQVPYHVFEKGYSEDDYDDVDGEDDEDDC